jgi:hypothetical protein
MPRPDDQSCNARSTSGARNGRTATHVSTTDPNARLYRKSPGTGAYGHAERRAALDTIHTHAPGSTRQLTLDADRGYDSADFVRDLLQACVRPHVA